MESRNYGITDRAKWLVAHSLSILFEDYGQQTTDNGLGEAGIMELRIDGITENWLRVAAPDNKTTSQRDNEWGGSRLVVS